MAGGRGLSRQKQTKVTLTVYTQLIHELATESPLTTERHIYRTAPLTSRCCILYTIQQIYVQNILNMLHTLRFFLYQMPFIS